MGLKDLFNKQETEETAKEKPTTGKIPQTIPKYTNK